MKRLGSLLKKLPPTLTRVPPKAPARRELWRAKEELLRRKKVVKTYPPALMIRPASSSLGGRGRLELWRKRNVCRASIRSGTCFSRRPKSSRKASRLEK